MPWVDGDQVQFGPSFLCAVFKNKVAGTQTEVILDLLLDAGGFYVGITGSLDHLLLAFFKVKPSETLKSFSNFTQN
jgi:hypothetical protein